jgi:hypothetical protein
MKSRENSSSDRILMITSIYNKKEIAKEKNVERTPHKKSDKRPIKLTENEICSTTNISNSSSLYFPKLKNSFANQRNNDNRLETNYSNYTKLKRPKITINLKKMELFIHPINKSVLEINKLIEIKDNLVKKRFNQLHNYKLQINPKNYYHNYGLNEYIEITNNYSKRNRNKSLDYQYNNISSYNNIRLKTEENKNSPGKGKIKFYKNISVDKNKKSPNLLTSVPLRIKGKRGHNYIIANFNEETDFVNTNAIWRGKKMNDIINNKTNLNFFKDFTKNAKYLGKVKTKIQM